jgi:hypothetical protein
MQQRVTPKKKQARIKFYGSALCAQRAFILKRATVLLAGLPDDTVLGILQVPQ